MRGTKEGITKGHKESFGNMLINLPNFTLEPCVVIVCHYISIKLLKGEKIKFLVNDVQYLILDLIKDHDLETLIPTTTHGEMP